MKFTLQQTTDGKNFLNVTFGIMTQDLDSEVRIALSNKEYQVLLEAGVPLYIGCSGKNYNGYL
ncbi:hypothetical protein ACT7C8_01495 [Bacillus cereus]|uniref:hypothetical protein n=1 Tax=unclassified Bacillus cereus group TaxID=2750818 RepID=UPI001F5AA350